MNREPHSKYPNGIVKWELKITWDDSEVEVMADSLPEPLRNEIEQHLVDLEDLRAQNPEDYFMEAANEKIKFIVRNHNGTELGQFDTYVRAVSEANFYREQTGNPAYIEEQSA